MHNRSPLIDLKEISRGNASAFQHLFRHYYPKIYTLSLKYLKCADLSEDICQNVFIKIWNQRAQLDEVDNLNGWIFTIAKCQILDNLRHAARDQQVCAAMLRNTPQYSNSVADEKQLKDYFAFVEAILAMMPEQTRRVFLLCRRDGKSYQEAAEILGVSRDAIKKHMVRSMKILRLHMKNELDVQLTVVLLSVLFSA